MSVESQIDLYDSDILQIERVIGSLNESMGKLREPVAFQREIKERFAEIGLDVSVSIYQLVDEESEDPAVIRQVQILRDEGIEVPDVHEAPQDVVYTPVITINGRVERQEFDHDRMVHEVTNDLLDLGEGGVIKTGKPEFD